MKHNHEIYQAAVDLIKEGFSTDYAEHDRLILRPILRLLRNKQGGPLDLSWFAVTGGRIPVVESEDTICLVIPPNGTTGSEYKKSYANIKHGFFDFKTTRLQKPVILRVSFRWLEKTCEMFIKTKGYVGMETYVYDIVVNSDGLFLFSKGEYGIEGLYSNGYFLAFFPPNQELLTVENGKIVEIASETHLLCSKKELEDLLERRKRR